MRLQDISATTWIAIGLGLRMALLGWGTVQDAQATVPYTDVDYHVFTAASKYLYGGCPVDLVAAQIPGEEFEDLSDPSVARGGCAQGIVPATCRLMLQMEDDLQDLPNAAPHPHFSDTPAQQNRADLLTKIVPLIFNVVKPVFRLLAGAGNPYKRDTYRYTPLLALLLTPAEYLGGDRGLISEQAQALYGKLLFVLADLLVAVLLWDIMDIRSAARGRGQASRRHGWLVGLLWLANPFAAQISTRGSSESILGVLVLGFVDATIRGYPEIYLPTISGAESSERRKSVTIDFDPDPSLWSNEKVLGPFLFALSIHWKLYPIIYAAALVPHLRNAESWRAVVRFGLVTIYCLSLITGAVWAIWGAPFIKETILYHFHRSDHRHNFSPFFLPAYLTSSVASHLQADGSWSVDVLQKYQSVLGFIPQLATTAYIGFAVGGKDLIAALTFQTMAFVALNKVCTSQYFMWFIWFLPLLAPHLAFKRGSRQVVVLIAVWVAAQALWLSQAYLLEFKALDTFVRTWLASLVLLFVHAWLIVQLVQAWSLARQQAHKQSLAAEKKKQNGTASVKANGFKENVFDDAKKDAATAVATKETTKSHDKPSS